MILGRRSPGSWEGCRWSQQKGEQTLCRSRKVHGVNNHLTSGVWSTRTIGLLWNCISARGHDGSVYGSASVTSSLPARSSCKSGCHGSRLQVAGTKRPGQEKRELSRRCNCRDENSAMRRSSSGWLIWRRRDESTARICHVARCETRGNERRVCVNRAVRGIFIVRRLHGVLALVRVEQDIAIVWWCEERILEGCKNDVPEDDNGLHVRRRRNNSEQVLVTAVNPLRSKQRNNLRELRERNIIERRKFACRFVNVRKIC